MANTPKDGRRIDGGVNTGLKNIKTVKVKCVTSAVC